MELVRLLMLISLGHETVCLNSFYWTRSSKCYLATTRKFQYWISLPQCVKACLDRNDCNAIVIKSGARGTRRPCSLLNNRFVHTLDATPSQFVLYVARTSDAGGSTTDEIPSSRRAEQGDKDESLFQDVNRKDEAFSSNISQTAIINKRGLEQMETSSSSSSSSSPSSSSSSLSSRVEQETQPQHDLQSGLEDPQTIQNEIPSGPTLSPSRTWNKDREQSMTISFTPVTGKRTLSPRKTSSKDLEQSVTPVTAKQAQSTVKTDGGQPAAVHPGTASTKDQEQSIITPSTPVRITQTNTTQNAVQSSPRTHVSPSPRLAVLQQYTTKKRRKGRKHAYYVLNPETWTFIKRTVTISGKILKAAVDFDKGKIYWLEYLKRSRCSKLKSASLRSWNTTRVRSICTALMDIDTKYNTLYFVQKKRKNWIVFKQCIEFKSYLSTSLHREKEIYRLSSRFTMSCFRVDKDRLIFCSNHHETYTKVYIVDLRHKENEQYLKLKPKKTEIFIFPFKQHIYWTDRLGSFSASALKNKKTERLSGCGSTVRSLGSLGRYGGLWYLTCYTGKLTEIHFYDDTMKKVKSFKVRYEGVVASV